MLLRFLTSRFMSLSYDGQALPHAQAFIRFMMTRTMDSSENAGTAATPSASGLGKVGPAALKWLKENRGLSPGTLAQLDVASGTAFFPDADRKLPAVYFNYAEGKRRARFRRSISFPEMGSSDRFGIWSACSGPIPRRSTSSRGSSTPAPWSRSVFQPHRCSPLTAPRTNPPRAIRSSSRATPTSRRRWRPAWGRARKFIWCGDADDAGRILRDDMVRMLGAARFYFVEWPEGVKDANDMLLSDGLEELSDRVQNGYLPWPVADIYQLGSLPEPAPMTLWYPGFDEWERKVRLAPRTRSVVTGHTRVMPDRALEPDLVQCGQALRGRPHRRGARGGRCLDQRWFFFWCTRPTADA